MRFRLWNGEAKSDGGESRESRSGVPLGRSGGAKRVRDVVRLHSLFKGASREFKEFRRHSASL
jgi:hypothetical protein